MNERKHIQNIRVYEGAEKGPSLLFLGGVHGNEPCGTKACRRVIDDIEQGRINIERGRVTLIPLCNPKARANKVRFVDKNLNRDFHPTDYPQGYEDHLKNELAPYIEQADVLIDLHSYRAGGAPFVFSNGTEAEFALVDALDIPYIVYGWQTADGRNEQKKYHSGGTTSYALKFGALAVTIECGQHEAPESVVAAYQSILKAMRYYKTATFSGDVLISPDSIDLTHMVLQAIFYKNRKGHFVSPLKNFQRVKKGEILARYEAGEEIAAPIGGYIVMPDPKTVPGEEWFLIAKKEDPKKL